MSKSTPTKSDSRITRILATTICLLIVSSTVATGAMAAGSGPSATGSTQVVSAESASVLAGGNNTSDDFEDQNFNDYVTNSVLILKESFFGSYSASGGGSAYRQLSFPSEPYVMEATIKPNSAGEFPAIDIRNQNSLDESIFVQVSNDDDAVILKRYKNGATAEKTFIKNGSVAGNWVRVKAKIGADKVKAKAWVAGTTEPSDYQGSVSRGAFSAEGVHLTMDGGIIDQWNIGKAGPSLAGRVEDQSDAPLSNATVRVIGYDPAQLSNPLSEVDDRLNNPIPDKFDPDLPVPGQQGFRDKVANSGEYVAVHEPKAWETVSGLSSPTVQVPDPDDKPGVPVALSVWGLDGGLYEDEVDRQLPGVARQDTPIVAEQKGPDGSTIQTYRFGTETSVDPGIGNSRHDYAQQRLTPGVYEVYPEGHKSNSYYILAGSKSQVRNLISPNLTDVSSTLSDRSQYLDNLTSNGGVATYSTTTDSNGKWSLDLPPGIQSVRLQTYKVPDVDGLEPPITPLEIVQTQNINGLNSSIYWGTKQKRVTIPKKGVKLTARKVPTLQGTSVGAVGGINQLLSDFLTQVPAVSEIASLNTATVRQAIKQHRSLENITSSVAPARDYFCSETPTKCTGDAQLDLLDVAPSNADNVSESRLGKIRRENTLMIEALRNADSTPVQAENVESDLSTTVPESITETIELPFAIDSLGPVTVEAVWKDGHREEIAAQDLRIEQGYGPKGDASAIVVDSWSVPPAGPPSDFQVSLEDPKSGLVDEGIEAPSSTLNRSLNTSYDLTASEYAVLAKFEDKSQARIPESDYSRVNSTGLDIDWTVPAGKSVDQVLVDVKSQERVNNSDFAADLNTFNTTVTLDKTVGDGGTHDVVGVKAVLSNLSKRDISEQYWNVSGSKEVSVNDWPIPQDADEIVGITPQLTTDGTDKTVSEDKQGTVNKSFTVPDFDLTKTVWPEEVYAQLKDGSSDLVADSKVSNSGSSTVTVTEYQIPEDKTVDRFDVDLKATSQNSVSDGDGVLDTEWDTTFNIVTSGLDSNELAVQTVIANYSDGSTERIPDAAVTVNSNTNLSVGPWEFNSSKTVTNVYAEFAQSSPALQDNDDVNAQRVLNQSYDAGKIIDGTGNYSLGTVRVIFKDGSQVALKDKFTEVTGSQTYRINDWPIPDGKVVKRVAQSYERDDAQTNKSVSAKPADNLLNRTVALSEDLSKPEHAIKSVQAVYGDGSTAPITLDHYSITGDKEITVNSWPVPDGRTVDKVSVDITEGSSGDTQLSDVSDGGAETIQKTITLSDRINSTETAAVVANYSDGTSDQLSDSDYQITSDGYKVAVDWMPPSGKTVSNLSVQQAATGADDLINTSSVETVDETVQLPEEASASEITVLAEYQDGTTATIPSSEWSLTQGGTAVSVDGWTVPSGHDATGVRAEIDSVQSVSSDYETGQYLSLTAEFDSSGITGSDLTADDVSVLAHLGDGTTRTVSEDYWSVNSNIGRNDAVEITEWPVPNGTNVANVEVLVSGEDGVGSFSRQVVSQSINGELPKIGSLRLNTQYPLVGQGVRATLSPESPAVFGAIKRVTVTAPDGTEVNHTIPASRTVQFVPDTAGTHTLSVVYSNSANETFTETITVEAQDLALSAPPAARAEQSPTGVYAVVSDGFVAGEITQTEDGTTSVDTRIPVDANTPTAADVYLKRLEGETEGDISLDIGRGPQDQDLDSTVSVRLHTSPIPSDAHVRVNGDPITRGGNEYGNVSSADGGTVITAVTGPSGEATVSINRDPSLIDEATWQLDLLTDDLPVVFLFPLGFGLVLGLGRRRFYGGDQK